jgi:hypothetical protein
MSSKSIVPQSPPESIEEANKIVQVARKVIFPSLHFPSELIVSKNPPPPKIGV